MATNAVPDSVLAPEKVNVICYFLLQIARSGNVCGSVLIPFDRSFVSHHVPSNTNTKLISSRGCHNNLTLINYTLWLNVSADILKLSSFFFFFFFFLSIEIKNSLSQRASRDINITKTCLYNFEPIKPHFYIIKLEFTGVYIIFLISAKKHILWVLVRTASPRRF